LLVRTTSPHDKRRKHVALTARGRNTLETMRPALDRIQDRILAPLPASDRAAFARMLKQLVDAHAHADSAPAIRHEEAS
jgi:DNA-binding MarR family transcriptional regulator